MREGTVLCGRYRLDELIGRGGMADVFKAWDMRRQHTVAIKIIRADIAEDLEFVRRFRREAEALARLAHENIVRFYGFERDGLTALIVMDYVEGTTLRSEIARAEGPLPVEQVVAVTQQVCAALGYAHFEGIIHRDIKPGNILIRHDGRVLLSDFGIARAADATTVTAAMPGTPPYMSPEQCRGDEVDARTDIYSLGVVVYEMLTGRRPFIGETGSTGSTQERIRWEQMHAPPPPIRKFNPGVPAAAEAVVLRALAKNPADRWPDPAAFCAALSQALASTGTGLARLASSAATVTAMATPAGASVPAGKIAHTPANAPPPPASGAPTGGDPPGGRHRESRGLWVAGCLTLTGLTALIVTAVVLGLGLGRATWSPPTATARPSVPETQPSPTPRPPNTQPPLTAMPQPTSSPVPPTATSWPTATPQPPTATLQPPTATLRRPTDTPVPPTATRRPTSTRPPATATPWPTDTDTPLIPPPQPTMPSSSGMVTFVFISEYRATLDVYVDGQLVFRVQPGETKSVQVSRGVHRIGLCPLGYTNCPSSENSFDFNSDPFVLTLR